MPSHFRARVLNCHSHLMCKFVSVCVCAFVCGDRQWLDEMAVIYFDGETKQQENRIVILVRSKGKRAAK